MSIRSLLNRLMGSNRTHATSTPIAPVDTGKKAEPATDSTPIAPVDKWAQFANNELPAKLDWARSFDVGKVTEESSSTPETVERVSGFPTLWLEFGSVVQASEKLPLREVNALGQKILDADGRKSELWSWYQTYMNSSSGRGVIAPEEYIDLPEKEIMALDQAINVGEHVRRNLGSFTTMDDYLSAAYCVPEGYWRDDRYHLISDRCDAFYWRMDQILNAGHSACKSLEDLLKFYGSMPRCGEDNRYWTCACFRRRDVALEIFKILEEQLEIATTSAQVEAIEVPWGLDRSRREPGELSRQLLSTKKQVVARLQKQEEENRIRSALNK